MVEFGNEARASFGMEIEQFSSDVPRSVSSYGPLGDWHSDASGPIETEVGPYKLAKPLAKKVTQKLQDTTGQEVPWEWKAASNRTGTADGAGSHVHFHLNDPESVSLEDKVEAWTIAYNTIVELTPIFAPFFCADWKNGFRSGTTYPRSGEHNVSKWADPQTTRLSQSSVHQKVETGRASRSYKSVTFNGSRHGSKPLTIELRLNDAHSNIAMVGLTMMKKLVVEAIERGWSVKSEGNALNRTYEAAYPDHTYGIFSDMQETGEISFLENRGIPRLEGQSFDSAFEALQAIIESFNPKEDGWRDRVSSWVHSGQSSKSPVDNQQELWTVIDEDSDWTIPR